MDTLDNDLLISAYLDGELTGDERARVEQMLATSAEARQLVEELRALRAGLQELPQHQLEPEFAQVVLRRAEQESQAADHRPSPPKKQAAPETSAKPWYPRPWANRRGIGWAIVALAAALVIMVTGRERGPDGQAVDQPGEKQLAQAPARGPQENRDQGEFKALDKVAENEAPDAGQLRDIPQTITDESVEERARARRDNLLADDRAPLTKDNFDKSQLPSPQQQGVPLRSFALDSAESTPRLEGKDEELLQQRLAAGSHPATATMAQDITLVRVDISRAAANDRAFEALLAKNQIALDERDLKRQPIRLGLELQKVAPENRKQPSDAPSGDALQAPGIQPSGDAQQDAKQSAARDFADGEKKSLQEGIEQLIEGGLKLDEIAAPPRNVDVLLVEASPEQIDATLAALKAAPQTFLSVSLVDAGGVPALRAESEALDAGARDDYSGLRRGQSQLSVEGRAGDDPRAGRRGGEAGGAALGGTFGGGGRLGGSGSGGADKSLPGLHFQRGFDDGKQRADAQSIAGAQQKEQAGSTDESAKDFKNSLEAKPGRAKRLAWSELSEAFGIDPAAPQAAESPAKQPMSDNKSGFQGPSGGSEASRSRQPVLGDAAKMNSQSSGQTPEGDRAGKPVAQPAREAFGRQAVPADRRGNIASSRGEGSGGSPAGSSLPSNSASAATAPSASAPAPGALAPALGSVVEDRLKRGLAAADGRQRVVFVLRIVEPPAAKASPAIQPATSK